MAMDSVQLEVLADGVALITISNPPDNNFTIPVLRSLKSAYEEAMRRSDVKAIVVTGANNRFCGGMDVMTLKSFQDRGDVSDMKFVSLGLFTRVIEAGKKPSVAAIDGAAFGVGLELALCCHARIATTKTKLASSELQIGVIPGCGGTQRLPRVIGVAKSLEMMMTSRSVSSQEAADIGLIDAVVPDQDLIAAARRWALDIASYRRRWLSSLYHKEKLESENDPLSTLAVAEKKSERRMPNVTHPLLCIDAIKEGVVKGGLVGIEKELENFEECLLSGTARSLVHIYMAQRDTGKIPGLTDLGLKPRIPRKVGVIGGGLMGSGIATACVLNGIPVIVKEINSKFLQAGLGRIKANLESRLRKGRMTQEGLDMALALVEGTVEYDHFKNVDLVIEAVIENPSLKQQIFSVLEKVCPSTCVLASNTSTIDLNVIGQKMKAKDRIAGAHFFSPAHVMQLFEIIRTNDTSPQVLIDLLEFGKSIKKIPIVVGNCPGFAVNRTFLPYMQAALLLVDLGVDVYVIDKAITDFGMPMGPFRLSDLVGFDVGAASGATYRQAYPDRLYKSILYPLLIEDKRLGEKTGKGFYTYDNGRKARPDPKLQKYMEKARSYAKIMPDNKPIKVTSEEIVEMIFFPVINEACRVLADGVVSKASDIDIASIMGMGFPAYRGGLLFWADSMGAKHIYMRLNDLSKAYGDFFKPCFWLEHCASRNLKLSSPVEVQCKL